MHPSAAPSTGDRSPEKIQFTEPWTDRDITGAIGFAVRLALPSFEFTCECHDGIAIVTGTLSDNHDRLQVLDLAADVPGVRHVIDRITVVDTPVAFGSRWSAKPIRGRAA